MHTTGETSIRQTFVNPDPATLGRSVSDTERRGLLHRLFVPNAVRIQWKVYASDPLAFGTKSPAEPGPFGREPLRRSVRAAVLGAPRMLY